MKRNRIKKDNFQKLQNTILKISIWGVLGNLIFLMQGMESSVLWMPEDQVLSDLEARPDLMVFQIELMMILVAWTLYRGVQSYLEQAPGNWAISSLVESGLALGGALILIPQFVAAKSYTIENPSDLLWEIHRMNSFVENQPYGRISAIVFGSQSCRKSDTGPPSERYALQTKRSFVTKRCCLSGRRLFVPNK